MVKSSSMGKLREALAELVKENGGKVAGVTLEDVCARAGASRATAYRGEPSFKSEFDAASAPPAKPTPATKAEKGSVRDKRSDALALASRMANRLQAMALELERERALRRRETGAPPVQVADTVIPFPDGRQRI